ncbi:MAG: nucleotide sugar dehydrogenase [Candidatus Omnitrophica bacterium]|nr:nucleotide sugar dehydrogenase [Candidatus Omnitrophota bacterium]
MSAALKRKIITKEAKIAVLGLGYVGLPLAVNFAKAGYQVVGIDKNVGRVKRVQQKKSYISDIPTRELEAVVRKKKLKATMDFSELKQSDVILVCVPTPLKRKYTPDISYIDSAVKEIQKHLKKNTLVIFESTTYPGTTNELIKPGLEKAGLKAGKDFYLAFSPERIDPGNKSYDVTKIPKVVGGITPKCGALTKLLYQKVIKSVHLVSSTQAAEMTKLLENSFRIINIGWINEVAMMCHKLDIDVWEVIEAAKTKPFGFMPFYPGLGVGGHCIPDDPLYLYWKAKQYGFNSKFIKLSADTNVNMPVYAKERLREILKRRKKRMNTAKILIIGVTYKKDVRDLRKSSSLSFIEVLKMSRCHVDYYDPIIPYLDIGNIKMKSVKLDAKQVAKYDCVVIATDHTHVDYKLILNSAKVIFDIKNVYHKTQNKKIFKF